MKCLFLQILAIFAVSAALQVAFAIFDASQSTRESFSFGVGAVLGVVIEIIDERHRKKNGGIRNCDRFANTESALDAFIRESEVDGKDADTISLRVFFDWLFATAKKGGAK